MKKKAKPSPKKIIRMSERPIDGRVPNMSISSRTYEKGLERLREQAKKERRKLITKYGIEDYTDPGSEWGHKTTCINIMDADGNKKFKEDVTIDEMMVPVFTLLNTIPGITTTSSCQGIPDEDAKPYIAFKAASIEALSRAWDACEMVQSQGDTKKITMKKIPMNWWKISFPNLKGIKAIVMRGELDK